MTLGEYPTKVDPKFRISLDRFTHSEFNIGKFRDVGHLVGVNRFNQAGGAIMEDFDNDGLLDLVTHFVRPDHCMAYYRNKGDGSFEDRSREAGVTNQLGGLVCYQADFNNDGRMDVFIPRGAWLAHAFAHLLRNNGGGTFVDVTRESGCSIRSTPTRPVGAILTTTAGSTCSLAVSSSPTGCITIGGTGPSRKSPPRPGGAGPRASARDPWVDFDNDDHLDLFLNNLNGTGELYRNNRDGTFTNVTFEMGIDGPEWASRAGPGTTTTTAGSTSSPPAHRPRRGGQGPAGPPHVVLQQTLPQ